MRVEAILGTEIDLCEVNIISAVDLFGETEREAGIAAVVVSDVTGDIRLQKNK